MSIEALSGKVYMLVTGASRGIGKQIAISLGSVLEKGSRVLLLARNSDGLKETAKCIPADVLVNTVGVDLGKVEDDELHGEYKKNKLNAPFSTVERYVEFLNFIY